eukprot:TRINITY_DN2777_c0_g2_i1.p1 TRINITY_DN2777_c0_g2~~TRINITY_DN2777_c0_g2_i1.p1  ORF type:complete len:132 (+),score=20.27 TRINITY_DN2777_c0_g2_i1:33-398(+)
MANNKTEDPSDDSRTFKMDVELVVESQSAFMWTTGAGQTFYDICVAHNYALSSLSREESLTQRWISLTNGTCVGSLFGVNFEFQDLRNCKRRHGHLDCELFEFNINHGSRNLSWTRKWLGV